MLRAYRRIPAAAGGEVVVDSSKGVDWLRALLDAGLGGDVRAIVVARSPFAFVASNRARLPGRDVVWHAAGWRNIYQHTLRALAAQGIPQVSVRHEELVHAPEAWGARLGAFLGLDPAGFDLARVHARPAHPLGGNLRELARMRGFDREGLRRSGVAEARDLEGLAARAPDYLSPRPVLPERAEAWRDLSLEEMVAVIQTPGVVEVFNALGYSLRSFLDKAPPPPPSAG
jgi:hypothetical protein